MSKRIVMADPKYFDVTYKINPWMDPNKGATNSIAVGQWRGLMHLYRMLGSRVEVIDPEANLPDFVFSANAFFAIGKKAVLSRFRYPQRQPESEITKKWLERNGFAVIDPYPIVYEGEGDTFLVSSRIIQGYGFRSDPSIEQVLKLTYPDKEIVLLKLVDERFYHTDICFFPMSEDLAFYYPGAFDEQSRITIKNIFKNAVEVTEEEVTHFSLNAIKLGETVVLNSHSDVFGYRLQSWGFSIQMTDTSEFEKSGGSVKCMSNEIYEDSFNQGF